MAESEKNARRSDEAERSRHISATESVAFATMLLGLLNDADAVLHRLEHEGEARAAKPPHPLPAELVPAALVPADPEPNSQDQHAGTIESPSADLSPALHADASATTPPQDADTTLGHTPAGDVLARNVLTSSPALSSFSTSIDHAPSTAVSTASHGGSITLSSFNLGASVHTLADTVTGIVDTALATVSSTISSLSATVGQLTSTLTDTVSHLVDGLIHDTPASSLLAPLTTDLSGLTSSATDLSGATPHDIPLLDTAGAIPTSLLHPIPLRLGFLGQPTMDGHEPHDGAFSALGVHHF